MKSIPQVKHSDEIGRLLHFVWPYSAWLFAGIVLLAIMALANVLAVISIRPAVDIVLNPQSVNQRLALFQIPYGGPTIDLNFLVPSRIHHVWSVFSIAVVLLFLIKGITEYFGSTLIQHAGLSAVTDIRNEVYERVVHQPVGFFHHNPVGRVMSAVISDVEQMRAAFSDYLADFFRQLFSLIVFTLALLAINWKLAVASAVLVPLVVWPVGKLARRIRGSSEKSRSRLADLSQILQETISGNRVVKAFGMENFEIRKFREAARNLLRENMHWIRAYAVTSPLMSLLGAAVICMILLFARDQIRAGVMSTGIFIAFVFALFSAYEPVKRLGNIYQLFQQAVGVSTQVFSFLDLQPEVMETPGAKALPKFTQGIEFDNASFAYEDNGGNLILRDINLTVRAGAVVAIVGSSGAGKTTLVNLLPRFYTATAGSVLVDRYDVRGLTLRSLREQMAIVTQETILFNDTIWNNLCYGRPKMPEEQVYAAAKAALAHDFIMEMPQKYQTLIGDRGQRLSGGQRQRLAIARALLKDAPILILDEATSELDSESEMLVQSALNNLMAGRTVFVIAHRLSTIRRADMIAVLEGGTIRELGSHEELMLRGGLYARLYEIQFRDVEPASRAAGPM